MLTLLYSVYLQIALAPEFFQEFKQKRNLPICSLASPSDITNKDSRHGSGFPV